MVSKHSKNLSAAVALAQYMATSNDYQLTAPTYPAYQTYLTYPPYPSYLVSANSASTTSASLTFGPPEPCALSAPCEP